MLNPWGMRFPDLSGTELSISQKAWLADQLISGLILISLKELSLMTKIPAKTFYSWMEKIRCGKKIFGNGRPPALAPEYLPQIKEFVLASKTSISSYEGFSPN